MVFNDISRCLLDKLDSLWNLADTHHPEENEIKQFTDKISNSWTSINRQVIFYVFLEHLYLLSVIYILFVHIHMSIVFI